MASYISFLTSEKLGASSMLLSQTPKVKKELQVLKIAMCIAFSLQKVYYIVSGAILRLVCFLV